MENPRTMTSEPESSVSTSNSGQDDDVIAEVNEPAETQPDDTSVNVSTAAGSPSSDSPNQTSTTETTEAPQGSNCSSQRCFLWTYLANLWNRHEDSFWQFVLQLRTSVGLKVLLLLCVARGILTYGFPIVGLVILHIVFMFANKGVVREIRKGADGSPWIFVHVIVSSAGAVALTIALMQSSQIYLALVYHSRLDKYHKNFWTFIWSIAVLDHIAKLLTLIVKALIALLPRTWIWAQRGKVYQFLEYSSQVYRRTLPIIPWCHFIVTVATHFQLGEFCSALVGAYIGLKLYEDIRNVVKKWLGALRQLVNNKKYGSKPTEEQVKAAGGCCTICQSDYVNPIRLECTHIFCDECVGKWFIKKTTCPICRTVIVGNVAFKDGSTSARIQFV